MIQKLATFLANILKFHKAKIGLVFASALLIGIIIFPYDDLADVVSSMISKGSNNQIYMQFDKLGLDLFPSPGLSLENVEIDTPMASGIQAGELSIAPSIPSLLMFKLGLTTRLVDFLNGKVVLSYRSGGSIQEVDGSGHYEVSANSLDLAQVAKVMSLDLPLRGRINLDAEGDFDAKFQEPARAEFELSGQQLQLLPTMHNIPNLGPMNLPGVTLSQVTFKGRFLPQERGNTRNQLSQELILEEVILGTNTDLIQGRIRGKVDVQLLQAGPGNIRPVMGDYDLRVQITAKPAAEKDFGLFLSFLNQHKKDTSAGSVYQFRVAGRAMGSPPSITTLQVFQ